ncbi:MAG: sigma 54-interacting transcriptional regulator [Acidobacteriota bacterium]
MAFSFASALKHPHLDTQDLNIWCYSPHMVDTGIYERVVTELSARLIGAQHDDVAPEIEAALERIARTLQIDEVSFFSGDEEGRLAMSFAFVKPGLEPPRALGAPGHPGRGSWLGQQLREGHTVTFSSLEELPPPADAERQALAGRGVKSGLLIPLLDRQTLRHVIAFFAHEQRHTFTAGQVSRLRLLGDLLGAAVHRQRSDRSIAELTARLQDENTYLRSELAAPGDGHRIVGDSLALEAVLHKVEQVASTDAPVLLLGETGTGKELFAHAVHDASRRSERSLVKVNCAALPATLIESELFGHVKGAFTGATTDKRGRFELADGGTLFLDEIGDMELSVQSRLLRVLQEGEYEPVGSAETRTVDARVVAATNRDLGRAASEGRFRPDLFYRLNVFPIELPPLRDRKEDVEPLVRHFVERGNQRLGRAVETIPAPALDLLLHYDWPGNVRELQNVIDRALIVSRGVELELEASFLASGASGPTAAQGVSAVDSLSPPPLLTLAEAERRHILSVLQACQWRINGDGNAAEHLEVHPSTLRHRMKKLGIERPDPPA